MKRGETSTLLSRSESTDLNKWAWLAEIGAVSEGPNRLGVSFLSSEYGNSSSFLFSCYLEFPMTDVVQKPFDRNCKVRMQGEKAGAIISYLERLKKTSE